MAATLRAFYYPKQRAYFTSKRKLRVTKKTRRAGATSGGCREFIARAVEYPGWRGTYVATTKKEARERAWSNDTKSGLLDLLREFGVDAPHPSCEVRVLGGVRADIRDQAMTIDFSNGSRIDLFGADDMRALRKQRGLSKHVYWIDEAQDFRFLEHFYDAVIIGSLTDYDGECWLSGTPGRDCAGMFYDASKDDESDGPMLTQWESHSMAVVDNPYFGKVVNDAINGRLVYFVEDNQTPPERTGPFTTYLEAEQAATKVRWARTAGAALTAKGWKGDEPDFIREWLGRWSKADARYVYPVHAVNPYDLLYAQQRLEENPMIKKYPKETRFDGHPMWLDLKRAIIDLPKMPKFNKRRQWMYAIGADFGYHPDPFALVVWAFSHDTQDVYELFSWKATRVHTDDQGEYMKLLWQALDNVVVFVGDAAGKQDDFEVWRTRMGLPLDEANKQGKNTLEEFLADDIRRGRVHLRHDSPLHDEMKHLVYLPTKPGKTREAAKHRRSSDGKIHGDHCCFVAGTPVRTLFGDRLIETIKVGDAVLTREGWKPVTHAFEPSTEPTWRLITDDGREIVGTADHPIWAENGWIPLAELTPGAILTTCDQKPSPSTTADTGATQNTKTDRCASTSDEASKSEKFRLSNISTERSGKASTGLSQTGTTSTTETRTHSIMLSITSPASVDPIILASTPARRNASRCPEQTWPQLAKELKPGMGLHQVLYGMSLTDEKPWQRVPWLPSRVPTAPKILNPRTLTPSSAATLVVRRLGVPAVSTIETATAQCAVTCSDVAGTSNQTVVAPTRVLRVEPTGKREAVYNLTVADAHEYYADGILVSNCDAARYSYEALTHYLSKVPETVPDPKSAAGIVAEGVRHEQNLDKTESIRAERLAQGDEELEPNYEY